MTLNNDTRISKDFFAGLLEPRLPTISAWSFLYMTRWHGSALPDNPGPAADYMPVPLFRKAPSADRAALMFTREARMAAGKLYSRSFGSLVGR